MFKITVHRGLEGSYLCRCLWIYFYSFKSFRVTAEQQLSIHAEKELRNQAAGHRDTLVNTSLAYIHYCIACHHSNTVQNTVN